MFSSNRQGAHFALGIDVPLRRDAELPRHAHAPVAGARGPPARPRAARADAQGDRGSHRPLVRVRLAGHPGRDGPPSRSTRSGSTGRSARSRRPPAATRSTRSSTSRSPRTSTPSSCSSGPPTPERRAATERMIRSPVVMAGSSDGGAHLLSFCGADYTTRLLTEWVPRRAHARGGGGPAHVDPRPRPTGIEGRGTLAEGMAADLLLIDRDRLGSGDAPALRAGLPRRLGPVRRRRRAATGRWSSTARRCSRTASGPARPRARSSAGSRSQRGVRGTGAEPIRHRGLLTTTIWDLSGASYRSQRRLTTRAAAQRTGSFDADHASPKPSARARRTRGWYPDPSALVAQRIEHRPPEPCAGVRVAPRAPPQQWP